MNNEKESIYLRSLKYGLVSLVISVFTMMVVPFLSPLFFWFGTLFGDNFIGYYDAFDPDWFGMVSSGISVYITLVICNEFITLKDSEKDWGNIAILIFKLTIGFFVYWMILLLFSPAYTFVCNLICI